MQSPPDKHTLARLQTPGQLYAGETTHRASWAMAVILALTFLRQSRGYRTTRLPSPRETSLPARRQFLGRLYAGGKVVRVSWGNGKATGSTIPVAVLNSTGNVPLSGVLTVSAGFQDACALTQSKTVLCWGANSTGLKLGEGASAAQVSSAVGVMDSTGTAQLGSVVGISIGEYHACAVTNAGAALCWGGEC